MKKSGKFYAYPVDSEGFIFVSLGEEGEQEKDNYNVEIASSEVIDRIAKIEDKHGNLFDLTGNNVTASNALTNAVQSEPTQPESAQSETFPENRHQDKPEEKIARALSPAGHPSEEAQREAARQEVHEGKNEALKDKWRKDAYEGNSSEITADSFECQDDRKDCRGECFGEATLDQNGKCCLENERDCLGQCFGPAVVGFSFQGGFLWGRCCDPNKDINCCAQDEYNCKYACPNGVHPADGPGVRLSQYRTTELGGCCHPEEFGCCDRSEFMPCAKNATGLKMGSCSQHAQSDQDHIYLNEFSVDGETGAITPRCCDPAEDNTCCEESSKICGLCPQDSKLDDTHYIDESLGDVEGNCCRESLSDTCCEESSKRCGACKHAVSEDLWQEIEDFFVEYNGQCYDCREEDCNLLCEDSEKKCGYCPDHPFREHVAYVNPSLGDTPGNCCDTRETGCCAESERDCDGNCNGPFVLGPGGTCCHPDSGISCCDNFDGCGRCPEHANYKAGSIINFQGECCDPSDSSDLTCCEKLDCCGQCNKYNFNGQNKCVDSNGAQCPQHQ